jgi:predicted HD superfamily hydrolase involved in NAD metabolism
VSAVEFDRADRILAERLGEKSLAHSRAVAETAGLLASVYGVDPDAARLAGLLHDWDREVEAAELVSEAERQGMELSSSDREVPYLLHARTGAGTLQQAFPDLEDEIRDAIARHTLGAADMSELDMVVYIADMISADRIFPGVGALREAVGNMSLGDLFALCYQQSVSHLVATRKRIHPQTVSVWNSLVARASND